MERVTTVQKTTVVTGHCDGFTLRIEGTWVRLSRGEGETLTFHADLLPGLQSLLHEIALERSKP